MWMEDGARSKGRKMEEGDGRELGRMEGEGREGREKGRNEE